VTATTRRPAHATGTDERTSRYIRSVQQFPLLAPEEEQRLARQWVSDRDEKAAHTLVNSHLRLVAKIAMGYRGYGLPVDDLIAQGNLGLMQAIERFDPERGFRLATYAMWWIRAAIQEYIVHSHSLVKLGTTSEQKKLFFNLRRLKNQMQALEEGDLLPENVTRIADALNVPEKEVISMNRRLASGDASLNAPLRGDGETEWQDWLLDDGEGQEAQLGEREETAHRRHVLADAISTLNQRERDIVSERHLRDEPLTLEQLSHRYGISRERVRQIEVGALQKIRKIVTRSLKKQQLEWKSRPLIGVERPQEVVAA
jgi:RNA polymerase sigma-32 factor